MSKASDAEKQEPMNASAILTFVGKPTTPDGKENVAHHEHVNGARSYHYRRAIRHLVTGWAEYAEAAKHDFDSTIGEDSFLGDAWKDIGEALLTLLNGEIGGYDGGSLNANIRNFASANGITLNE